MAMVIFDEVYEQNSKKSITLCVFLLTVKIRFISRLVSYLVSK